MYVCVCVRGVRPAGVCPKLACLWLVFVCVLGLHAKLACVVCVCVC